MVAANLVDLTGRLVGKADAFSTTTPRFYLYGIRDPQHAASFAAGSVSSGSIAVNSAVVPVAAPPVRSPDGSGLGLVSFDENGTTPAVVATLLDTASGTVRGQGRFDLGQAPDGVSVLVTSVFTADSATLCLVLSLTAPTETKLVAKVVPSTGEAVETSVATWVSHHALAYFSLKNGLTGLFDLMDAPSLALVNAFADETDLFLWTLAEPAAVMGPRGQAGPMPIPKLSAYAVGSRETRFTAAAPGPWPVNGEPIVGLPNGQFARLVYSRDIEVYSVADGAATTYRIADLDPARGRVSMTATRDGKLFLANAETGTAVLVDPLADYQVSSVVRFPVPAIAHGAPSQKAAVSASGDAVYTLGPAATGGIALYDLQTGALTRSYSNGQHFSCLQTLTDGTVLCASPTSPRLTLLSPSLDRIGDADFEMHVALIV